MTVTGETTSEPDIDSDRSSGAIVVDQPESLDADFVPLKEVGAGASIAGRLQRAQSVPMWQRRSLVRALRH
jgi:hypothetical protein